MVCNYQLHTTQHGVIRGKTQTNIVKFYNLDMILAIGYRVRSLRGIQFRNYATTILKEYLIKGFAMDDERLKNLDGGNYFKELLDRIRDIRSSEAENIVLSKGIDKIVLLGRKYTMEQNFYKSRLIEKGIKVVISHFMRLKKK